MFFFGFSRVRKTSCGQVQVFSDRLKAGDPALCEEHERAYRIVMVEGQAAKE